MVKSTLHTRPLLKGVFHLIAFIWYSISIPNFMAIMPPEHKYSLMIYLLAVIGNFGCSAMFHIIRWPASLHIYVQRVDHVMIFLKIAATYYACVSTIVPDTHPLVLYTVLIGTILGIITRLWFTEAHKLIIAIPYLIVGWAIILDPNALMLIFQRTPMGFIMALIGGVSYTVGGIIYIIQNPQFCPAYIGYHEVFHIFSIVGTMSFTYCIFGYGLYVNHVDHVNPYSMN